MKGEAQKGIPKESRKRGEKGKKIQKYPCVRGTPAGGCKPIMAAAPIPDKGVDRGF